MTAESPTPSGEGPDLDELKLSPEVAWYLESRGIPLPECPPKFKTPEPRDVPGSRFDPERVDKVIAAFMVLRHTQGQWAGKPLKPDPWQVAYVLAPVFGWVRWDEGAGDFVRIITTLYVDVPRRNGKTTLCGGIALYLTGGDGEPAAQVVAAATTTDQAALCFNPVRDLVTASKALQRRFKPYRKVITHQPSGSTFRAVSSVGAAQHGQNLHGAIVDELHVHKTGDLVEAIETGTGSRRQPLVVFITTPDDGRTGTVYDQKRRRVEQLARGALHDPSTYGVIWGADEDDDPFAEETHRKANPGYGISPTRRSMADAATKARNSPVDLASFLRLRLGVRTRQQTRYITLAAWDRSAGLVDRESLAGRRAFGGLDLGSTSDLSSFALVFPSDDPADGYDVLWRLWAPEDSLDALDARTAREASAWVKAGLLELTPGSVTDYEFIRARINADRERYAIEAIGYDRWNATDLVNRLTEDDGAPMESLGQGFVGMSAPTKDLQRLVLASTPERPLFRHGGNAAIRWQVDNLAVATDPAGNVKPDKAKAGDKIDGVVAAIIALHLASKRAAAPEGSAYDDHDLEVV